MKKTWQSPRLIILARSKPEEVVLTGCKTMHGDTGSANVYLQKCDIVVACYECSLAVSS